VAATVAEQGAALERLARVGRVSTEPSGAGIGAHAVLKSGIELFLPLEGVIDVARERTRLAGEIEKLDTQLAGTEKKLSNEAFVSRAPAEVVDKERERAVGLREQAAKLREKLYALQGVAS
jgi:valyl-tRNA synthetase